MNDDTRRTDSIDPPDQGNSSNASATAGEVQSATTAGSPAERSLHWGRILLLVLPLSLALLAGGAFFALGGAEWAADLMAPPLAPVEVEVVFQGRPLTSGALTTRPLRSGVSGAIGVAGEDGRFRLKTDVKGILVDGASVGKHKVTVAAFGPPRGGAGPPPLASPTRYASFEETPLVIGVTASPNDNRFRFEIGDQ
jgi:hypothetical protein